MIKSLPNIVLILVLLRIFSSYPELLQAAANSSHQESLSAPFTEKEKLESGFYVVVGVFEYRKNAEKYFNKLQARGLEVSYHFHAPRGYFYVYSHHHIEKEEAVSKCLSVRSVSGIEDAWVFHVSPESYPEGMDIETIESVAPGVEDGIREESVEKASGLNTATTYASTAKPAKQADHIHHFSFHPINSQNEQELSANIKIVDGNEARLITTLGEEMQWSVKEEEAPADTVQLVVNAIGYRKKQFDLPFPITDSLAHHISREDGKLKVELPMIKMEPGDIQVLYNTYFYGNSSVMREHSRYELQQLYDFLQEDENVRIKLHGHTNGNYRGKVYIFDEKARNYFDIMRTREYTKRGVSSRKLSAYRAETIRSYLITRGIAPERIETEGWGGKKMLYEIDSPMAKNNIRVEVEVIE